MTRYISTKFWFDRVTAKQHLTSADSAKASVSASLSHIFVGQYPTITILFCAKLEITWSTCGGDLHTECASLKANSYCKGVGYLHSPSYCRESNKAAKKNCLSKQFSKNAFSKYKFWSLSIWSTVSHSIQRFLFYLPVWNTMVSILWSKFYSAMLSSVNSEILARRIYRKWLYRAPLPV